MYCKQICIKSLKDFALFYYQTPALLSLPLSAINSAIDLDFLKAWWVFFFWKFQFCCHFWITQKNFMLRIMLFFVIVEMGRLRILWVLLLWSNLITPAQFWYHFWISQKNYAQNCVVLCNCGTGSLQNLVGFASLINLLLLLIWLVVLTWWDPGILFRTTFFFPVCLLLLLNFFQFWYASEIAFYLGWFVWVPDNLTLFNVNDLGELLYLYLNFLWY